jgi:hypothetical protein
VQISRGSARNHIHPPNEAAAMLPMMKRPTPAALPHLSSGHDAIEPDRADPDHEREHRFA